MNQIEKRMNQLSTTTTITRLEKLRDSGSRNFLKQTSLIVEEMEYL